MSRVRTMLASLAVCALLALFVAPSLAHAQSAGTVSGTVTYRQRSALPNNAVVTIQLVDVSRADAAATVIAEQKLTTNGAQVPIPFSVAYQPSQIVANGRYAVQASITYDGARRFINDTQYPVLTNGRPSSGIAIVLVPVSGRLPNTSGGGAALLLAAALAAFAVGAHLWRRQRASVRFTY